jgi:Protein of unknown function (DUF429)
VARVAGADNTPGRWSVVFHESGRLRVQKAATLSDIVDFGAELDIVAVDIRVGLLDAYEPGERACDREARKLLGWRRNSVFPAPVRPVLKASTYEDACARSRASSPNGMKSANRPTPLCRRSIRLMTFFRNGQNSVTSCGRCIRRCASANWRDSRCAIPRASSQVERKGYKLFRADVSSVPHLRTVRRVHAEATAAELSILAYGYGLGVLASTNGKPSAKIGAARIRLS